jgi:hypothetical protein
MSQGVCMSQPAEKRFPFSESASAAPCLAPVAQLLDPVTTADWDSLLARHRDATVFHGRGWAQTLAATYGHKPCYLGSSDAGAIQRLLPIMEAHSWLTGKKGVSLPFTDACPALASEAELAQLFQSGLEMGQKKGWKYLELRGVPARLRGDTPSLSFLGHTLDLSRGEDAVFRGFEASVRRAIRKAESSAVAITIGSELDAVRVYYGLHARTRQRQGVPPQPWRFFRNLHRHLLAAGHGFVVIARHKDRPIAGALFLHFGQTAIYKYGASDLRHQQFRGSNLVMWRGIQNCCQLGCRSLEFGRTTPDNAGLRRFKLGFGASEQTIDYLRFDLRRRAPVSMADRSSGPLNRLFRYVPRTAARWVGAMLYPHVT